MGKKTFHVHPIRSPDDHRADPDQDKPAWVRRYLELADLLIKRAQHQLGYGHGKREGRGGKAA